jgi:hypothetical protein
VFTLKALEPKEASMRIIEVDLHTRQRSLAMLNSETGELIEKTLEHDGDEVRKFYSALPGQLLVGIEATRSIYWFLKLMEDLEIDYQVGHRSKVRAAAPLTRNPAVASRGRRFLIELRPARRCAASP